MYSINLKYTFKTFIEKLDKIENIHYIINLTCLKKLRFFVKSIFDFHDTVEAFPIQIKLYKFTLRMVLEWF